MTQSTGKRPRSCARRGVAQMRRSSSTTLLDSALNVDHNENYRHPPEEGGAAHTVAHFLQACFLCKRHLEPGTNIYMYRNFSAFCSAECRHQQIVIDKHKEKWSVEVKVRKITESSVGANRHQSSATNQNV